MKFPQFWKGCVLTDRWTNMCDRLIPITSLWQGKRRKQDKGRQPLKKNRLHIVENLTIKYYVTERVFVSVIPHILVILPQMSRHTTI